jgi:hypothetical protein
VCLLRECRDALSLANAIDLSLLAAAVVVVDVVVLEAEADVDAAAAVDSGFATAALDVVDFSDGVDCAVFSDVEVVVDVLDVDEESATVEFCCDNTPLSGGDASTIVAVTCVPSLIADTYAVNR